MTTHDHYTWRDCESLINALDNEPRKIPELVEAEKRHSLLVKSDVNKTHIIAYKVWCQEFGETEKTAFQTMSRNVYAALGAWMTYSEEKRNVSKSVLVKIKNTENEKTHQLFVFHGLK